MIRDEDLCLTVLGGFPQSEDWADLKCLKKLEKDKVQAKISA